MKQLIKQTSHFPGEIVRHERAFPNSPICFYHLIGLPYFSFIRNFPFLKSQQKSYFCWLFFASYTFKNHSIK